MKALKVVTVLIAVPIAMWLAYYVFHGARALGEMVSADMSTHLADPSGASIFIAVAFATGIPIFVLICGTRRAPKKPER